MKFEFGEKVLGSQKGHRSGGLEAPNSRLNRKKSSFFYRNSLKTRVVVIKRPSIFVFIHAAKKVQIIKSISTVYNKASKQLELTFQNTNQ